MTESGAAWLAEAGVRCTGADTTAYERIPRARATASSRSHRKLLVDHGIPIIEHLNLEPAAAEGLTEFVFVLAPCRSSAPPAPRSAPGGGPR